MSVPKNNGPIVDPALCRCCRAIKKCRILTAEYTWMGKKEIYADMVMDCYGILLSHVDDNERDSGVCATCVVRLREAIAFRHQVLQCEDLFLQAKLEHHDEEEKEESKLKKLDLELKTEPKDYNSDHNSLDDRDEPCPAYSDDDAEDNKPLKKVEPKPAEPPPRKEVELKSEDSMDFHGDSSSDSDEPIKKKVKRKAKEAKNKANGAKKKLGKTAKKQKADTGYTETNSSETNKELLENRLTYPNIIVGREIREPEVHMVIKVEPCSETYETVTETITSTEAGTRVLETTAPKKRVGVRPVHSDKTEYQMLCEKLEANEDLYFHHYNMSKDSFEELFKMMVTSIEKQQTNYRKPIPARQRLAICLRYLKTGDSCRVISQSHGIGRTTAALIIHEVSKAIWDVLQPIYMPTPTKETWTRCEEAFHEIWKIPNCIGSVAGRLIIAKCKTKSQPSVYERTKCFATAAFIAVADPFYNLTLIDIGNYGKQDERDIFERTSFYKDFLQDRSLLPAKPLPDTETAVPRIFIGNEGLPLKSYMLREYPKHKVVKDPAQKNFNERIRAARTVDMVFDMLMANWKVFQSPAECSIGTGVHLTKAACCLHNYIRSRHGDLTIKQFDDVRKRGKKFMKGLVPFRPMNRRAKAAAMTVRDRFTAYFNR